MFLSAGKREEIGSGGNGDSEESPEGSSNGCGGGVNPFVDLVGAVVGDGSESDIGESSEFRNVVSAVAGTVEVDFNSLELSEGGVEVVPSGDVSGIVGKVLEFLEKGSVGSVTLGESVGKILSVEATSLEEGGVLSVLGNGIVELGEFLEGEVLLVLPEGSNYNQRYLD